MSALLVYLLARKLIHKCRNTSAVATSSLPVDHIPALTYDEEEWADEVAYDDLRMWIRSPKLDICLIDVREPDEFNAGAIPTAVNLPLSYIAAGALDMDAETFKERFGWEKPWSGKEIVLYCRSGRRSAAACEVARRAGYSKIAEYKGSWLDWSARESTQR